MNVIAIPSSPVQVCADSATWTGATTFLASVFNNTNLASELTGNFSITGTLLDFIAVPEPATWGLLSLA